MVLLRAVREGNYPAFAQGVQDGCDATQIDQEGRTLLHWVAITAASRPCGENLDSYVQLAADLVRYHGLSVDEKDAMGNTPLHLAVGACSPCLVYWFVSRHATLTENHQGQTPFSLARASLEQDLVIPGSQVAEWRADGGLLTLEPLLLVSVPTRWHEPERFCLSTALMMALLSKLAYRGNGAETGSWSQPSMNDGMRAMARRWGFRLLAVVQKESARSIILHQSARHDRSEVYVVAIRGTKTGKDALADIRAYKRSCETGRVHGGVNHYAKKLSSEVCEILEKEVGTSTPIYFTGHSLGGAIATLTMNKMASIFNSRHLYMYTFGQPRVGTAEFRAHFDEQFPHAYIVQRYLDEVPHLPSNRRLPFIGRYQHCGSLRFLDCNGQLYNDTHYQYEDIRRSAFGSFENPSLSDLRIMWTNALQQMGQFVHPTEEAEPEEVVDSSPSSDPRSSPLHSPMASTRNSSSPTIARSTGEHRSKILRTSFRGRFEDRGAHSINHYIRDIHDLVLRLGTPFSWMDRPDEAICSQLLNVSLPIDVFDESLKGPRYLREREQAYRHLAEHYMKLPDRYQWRLSPEVSCKDIITWISAEASVLTVVCEVEEALEFRHPEIIFDENSPLPLLGVDGLSPLVETAMSSLLQKILQVEELVGHDQAFLYCEWVYFLLPRSQLMLDAADAEENLMHLVEQPFNPYQKGLRDLTEHLVHSCDKRGHPSLLSRDRFRFEDTDVVVARKSQQYHEMCATRLRSVQAAKVLLSNYEYHVLEHLLQVVKVSSGVFRTTATGVVVGGLSVVYRQLSHGRHIRSGLKGSLDTFRSSFEAAGYAKSTAIGIELSTNIFACLDGVFHDLSTLARDPSNLLPFAQRHPERCRIVLDLLNGTYLCLGLAQSTRRQVPVRGGKWDPQVLYSAMKSFVERVFSLMKHLVATTSEEVLSQYLQRYAAVLVSIVPWLEKSSLENQQALMSVVEELQYPAAGEGVAAYIHLQGHHHIVSPIASWPPEIPENQVVEPIRVITQTLSENAVHRQPRKIRMMNAMKQHSPLRRHANQRRDS